MFKKIVLCLLVSLMLTCTCFAVIVDAEEAADGLLTVGEYDSSDFDMEGYETLIVQGGGA